MKETQSGLRAKGTFYGQGGGISWRANKCQVPSLLLWHTDRKRKSIAVGWEVTQSSRVESCISCAKSWIPASNKTVWYCTPVICGLSWARSSPSRLGRLASEPQGSPHPRARITSMSHHAWFFTWVSSVTLARQILHQLGCLLSLCRPRVLNCTWNEPRLAMTCLWVTPSAPPPQPHL